MRDPIVREFLLSFWKVHILHHADEQGIYGQWMLEELQRHGYRLSPGTLYPMLSRMAARGWLRSVEPKRSKAARIYRLTPRGREVLNRIRESLAELYHEVGGHEVGGHEVGGHEVGGHEVGGREVGRPRPTPHRSGAKKRGKRRQPAKPTPHR